jgi:hypothetical protein
MSNTPNKRLMFTQQVGLGQLLAATSLQNTHNRPIGGR